jgi:hypothetical protein
MGPFVRFYSYGRLFFQFNYFFGGGKIKTEEVRVYHSGLVESNNSETESKINGYQLTPGYSIFLDKDKKISVDVMVGYLAFTTDAVRFKGLAVGFGISGFLFKN